MISEILNATTGQAIGQGDGLVAVGAGLAMFGTMGCGVGQGVAASGASEGVARNPEAEAKIRTMMIIGAAIAESSALYCLVISFILLFVYTGK